MFSLFSVGLKWGSSPYPVDFNCNNGLRRAACTLLWRWQRGDKMQRSWFGLATTGCIAGRLAGPWDVLLTARFYLGSGKGLWNWMAQGMTDEGFMMKLLSKPCQLWPKIITEGLFQSLGWVSRCPESSLLQRCLQCKSTGSVCTI